MRERRGDYIGGSSPFEHKGKGGDDRGGECVSINNKNVVAHAPIERHFSDNVHSGIPKLEGNHGYVRLSLLKEVAKPSFPFHFIGCSERLRRSEKQRKTLVEAVFVLRNDGQK